jgi:hypothetical protein
MLSIISRGFTAVLLAMFSLGCGAADAPWSAPYPLPAVESLNPYALTTLDFDTNGDGMIDYRFVGDVNQNGILEWDDVQAAVDGLCDPNGDGAQNGADGKLFDLDGDGSPEPYCGTLHILPGEWVSRVTLDSNVSNRKDDQLWLSNYQGLWLRGSGAAVTRLKTRYSRSQYCATHYWAACGGVCSRESYGFITISDLTFEGLPARTWGKRDCDGDGLGYDDPAETDYRSRVLQSGIVVWNTPPHVGRNVTVRDVVVSQVDYNGFALGELSGLTAKNLRVLSAGGAGILLSGVRDSTARDLFVENVSGSVAGGGVTVATNQATNGMPEGIPTRNVVIENVVSVHNHMGVLVVANGAGGISNVVFRNIWVYEPFNSTLDPRVRGLTTEFGIRLQDSGCVWDANGDGYVNNPCYVANITFDGGYVVGAPSHGFSMLLWPGGPQRRYLVRGIRFYGNGHKINSTGSRDINVNGNPGLTFEGNTVVGADYNSDGVADLTSLMWVGSDNTVIRDNVFTGKVAGGQNALLYANYAGNIVIANNRFTCDNAAYCNSLKLSATTPGALVQGNSIDNSPVAGTGIYAAGDDAQISGNFVIGGDYAIDARGHRSKLLGNWTQSVSLGPVGNDIRVIGTDVRLQSNVCRPAAPWKYCIELGVDAVRPVLANNKNLTTPANVYLDLTGP